MLESTDRHSARPGIDWARIYQRLADASAGLAECWQPDEARQQRLLAEREQRLAQAHAAVLAQVAEPQLSVLEFEMAYTRYAVEMVWVKEVAAPKALTPVPCTPAFIAGLLNVRGQMVSVLNLQQFFGLPQPGLTNLNRVVIVQASGREVGLLADAIIGERKLPQRQWTALETPPAQTGATEPAWRGKYLNGVGSDGLQLLALENLLAAPELLVCEEVLP